MVCKYLEIEETKSQQTAICQLKGNVFFLYGNCDCEKNGCINYFEE
jgi:hypothetical protein